MTPFKCRVKHDPPNSYGDCLRMSVASMLDIEPPELVPHFYEDGCDAETGFERMRDFLQSRGFFPFWMHFPPDASLDRVLLSMHNSNPKAYYLLFGQNGEDSHHVVICRGGEVAFDSSWYPKRLTGPASNGYWTVCVFVPTKMVD